MTVVPRCHVTGGVRLQTHDKMVNVPRSERRLQCVWGHGIKGGLVGDTHGQTLRATFVDVWKTVKFDIYNTDVSPRREPPYPVTHFDPDDFCEKLISLL